MRLILPFRVRSPVGHQLGLEVADDGIDSLTAAGGGVIGCLDEDAPLLEVEVELHGVVPDQVTTSSVHHDRGLGKVLHERVEKPQLKSHSSTSSI